MNRTSLVPALGSSAWNHKTIPVWAELGLQLADTLTRLVLVGQEAWFAEAPSLLGLVVDHTAGRGAAGQEPARIGPISCRQEDRTKQSGSNQTEYQPACSGSESRFC